MLELIEYPGAAIGACAVGALLWYFGVHQPFVVAGGALLVGAPAGYAAEVALGRLIFRRRRRSMRA